ncbi:hypothetical protein EV401DRAFT_2063135 [Pisolithus croceorrhizus]|nr:hypothetical protein EV401DRAFT_2063135 [Pisolithus croceorrhizus]
MPRELRSRKPRTNYAALPGCQIDEGKDHGGPSSSKAQPQISEENDSEYAPEDVPTQKGNGDDGESSLTDLMDIDEEEEVVAKPRKTRKTRDSHAELGPPTSRTSSPGPSKGKSKQKAHRQSLKTRGVVTPTSTPAPSLPTSRPGKMYALPNPSAHHRHRAIPIYHREDQVERLDGPPVLFTEPKITFTNSMTVDQPLTERISKAWGYNVGPGPVWELLEDRSCFKESVRLNSDPREEASRRPRVYRGLSVRPGWMVLDYQDALTYLPTDVVTTEDGKVKPPPPVACYLGPFGEQTRVLFEMFDSHTTSEYFKEGSSYIFNAGSPVWGLDWCPTHPADRPFRQFKQYLAVAPFPSRAHAPSVGFKAQRPSPACVQIWALQPRAAEDNVGEHDDFSEKGCESGEMRCEMVLCLNAGPAQDIKWCPLPAHDPWDDMRDVRIPRKLGVLAGTFEDGSLSVYVVPDPLDIAIAMRSDASPIFVKLPEPTLRIELENTSCWSLDWANSEVLAVGCTNGCIAIYDVGNALNEGICTNILPMYYMYVHQSAVRAIAWIRAPPTNARGDPATSEDPTVIASGGYDGVECLIDIRDPHGYVVNRTRDVITTATYSVFAAGPVMIDHDNTVKAYSVSPTMLGRGHILMEPDGPVWHVHASDYHPQLAVGSADGSCSTTNLLKSMRRGGLVPLFVHKIYQLDYSRKTGEYRMLEHFIPRVTQERGPSVKTKAQTDDEPLSGSGRSTGAWPPEIGVHRVTWNCGNGLGCASLLASGSGSGLCRVDWLRGRWFKDRVPYVDVPKMRKEIDGGGDDSMDD